MKRYRLIKDLPTFKAGETFALLDSFETHGLYRESDGVMAYHQTTLYKFPNILMEWFEEIKPAEPLIKDEKKRKAVRAWAEALGQREQFLCIKNGTRLEISDGSPHLLYISFWADKLTLDSIDDRTYYTIAELCGEEEE